MDFETSVKIASTGLHAHKMWMNVVSSNLANANVTKAVDGKPYQRRTLIYEATPIGESFDKTLEGTISEENNAIQGVHVTDVMPDKRDFKTVFDPGHPDAGPDGTVLTPNVNPVEEMANLVMASRAYEANLAALNSTKQLAMKAIELGTK